MKKKITYEAMRQLALSLSVIKNDLLRLGLMHTYQTIDPVTKAIGWEIAEIIEGAHSLVELEDSDEYKDMRRHVEEWIGQ